MSGECARQALSHWGFLIAAMVWLVPSADTAKFHAVTLMTYLIAIGGFTHIVAGSMEAFLLVANGQLGRHDDC